MAITEKLSVSVDTSELKRATADLEAFTAAAKKAREALDELAAISKKVNKPVTINVSCLGGGEVQNFTGPTARQMRRALG